MQRLDEKELADEALPLSASRHSKFPACLKPEEWHRTTTDCTKQDSERASSQWTVTDNSRQTTDE